MVSFLMVSALLGGSAQSMEVLVSFQPYKSVVQNILGPQGKVSLLLPAGASPHVFDPTPHDLKKVAQADLALMNGGGIDHWMKGMVQRVKPNLPVLEVLPHVQFVPLKADAAHGGGTDPHIWLDASLMAKAAVWIGAELGKLDPANRQTYQKNAALEARKLQALHQQLKKELAPLKKQPVVTFHNAWGYWSRAYGPTIAATVEPFPGKEPSARYIKEVLEKMEQQRVQVVFGEPTLPEGPARNIAQMAGARYGVLVPEGSPDLQTYEQMMLHNRDVLLRMLRP